MNKNKVLLSIVLTALSANMALQCYGGSTRGRN